MADSKESTRGHRIRRDRGGDARREIVCTCGFVASGSPVRAKADYDAHARLRNAADRLASLTAGAAAGIRRRLGIGA